MLCNPCSMVTHAKPYGSSCMHLVLGKQQVTGLLELPGCNIETQQRLTIAKEEHKDLRSPVPQLQNIHPVGDDYMRLAHELAVAQHMAREAHQVK